MLFISEEDQKRLNRLIRYAVKRERRVLAGCKDIFDVGKRFRCQFHAISNDGWENTFSGERSIRFIVLPYELQTRDVICKIEYSGELQSSSKKAEVILELLKSNIDYTSLCKKFHLHETVEVKDYISMRIFLSLFVSKNSGIKVTAT